MEDQKTTKGFMLRVRVDPVTVQKLDQLACTAGGNRSEVIRQLIDQAAARPTQQAQQPEKGRSTN